MFSFYDSSHICIICNVRRKPERGRRIHEGPVDFETKMTMWAGGVAGASGEGDQLAGYNFISGLCYEFGVVHVDGLHDYPFII